MMMMMMIVFNCCCLASGYNEKLDARAGTVELQLRPLQLAS